METSRSGKIITFYSYKGGTGRSMALANVAWLLASAGKRVLTIDWDLEAPGLHRYFEPFLDDKTLENSTGLIDFVLDFASAAVTNDPANRTPDWFVSFANILLHAVSIHWDFANDGALHFVPAGRQDAAYGSRVNSFDWPRFYEKLGGGIVIEAMKKLIRNEYDYVLVDSRTGVSDTSGVCTVQMPDELVACFTLNRQSIYGASAAVLSALQKRTNAQGQQTLKVWPLPMRIEFAEKDRLETARALARTRFAPVFTHLLPDAADVYWGQTEVPYQPYYAYEEVLAVFRDRPRETRSLLASMEIITSCLTQNALPAPPLDDEQRNKGLQLSLARSSANSLEEMSLIGREYEALRQKMESGDRRTFLMTALVSRAQQLVGVDDAGQLAEQLFNQKSAGSRITGLALARKQPRRSHIEMAIDGISQSKSAFEQYHALLLAQTLLTSLDPTAKVKLQEVINAQLGKTITETNMNRWSVSRAILIGLQTSSPSGGWELTPETTSEVLGQQTCSLVEVRPVRAYATYSDVEESYGRFVKTRGTHHVSLPRSYRIATYLTTNHLFAEFVAAGGYEKDEFWKTPRNRKRFFTADGKTLGPASWPNSKTFPDGKAAHPVTGISFLEVLAFLQWCESIAPSTIKGSKRWSLPTEDIWEYTARTDAGLTYPWGDNFDSTSCNTSESGIGDTTEVTRYPSGASAFGCYDMAGNVWEFVVAADESKDWCVLRGGSFRNNRFESRSYLRLIRVPILHRPLDFGFRLCQSEPPIVATGATH